MTDQFPTGKDRFVGAQNAQPIPAAQIELMGAVKELIIWWGEEMSDGEPIPHPVLDLMDAYAKIHSITGTYAVHLFIDKLQRTR